MSTKSTNFSVISIESIAKSTLVNILSPKTYKSHVTWDLNSSSNLESGT